MLMAKPALSWSLLPGKRQLTGISGSAQREEPSTPSMKGSAALRVWRLRGYIVMIRELSTPLFAISLFHKVCLLLLTAAAEALRCHQDPHSHIRPARSAHGVALCRRTHRRRDQGGDDDAQRRIGAGSHARRRPLKSRPRPLRRHAAAQVSLKGGFNALRPRGRAAATGWRAAGDGLAACRRLATPGVVWYDARGRRAFTAVPAARGRDATATPGPSRLHRCPGNLQQAVKYSRDAHVRGLLG